MLNIRAAINVMGNLASTSVSAGGDLNAVKDIMSDMTKPVEFLIRGFAFWMGTIRLLQSALTFMGYVLADVVRLAADAASWIPGSFGEAAKGVSAVAKEIRDDLAFVERLVEKEKLAPEAALRNYALLILNTNEFFYLD